MKVVFIFIELQLSKKIMQTGQPDLYCESKTKKTTESPFHLIELRLSLCVAFCCKRKGHDMLSLDLDKLKPLKFQLWVLCHFQTFTLLQQSLFSSTFVVCVKVS